MRDRLLGFGEPAGDDLIVTGVSEDFEPFGDELAAGGDRFDGVGKERFGIAEDFELDESMSVILRDIDTALVVHGYTRRPVMVIPVCEVRDACHTMGTCISPGISVSSKLLDAAVHKVCYIQSPLVVDNDIGWV
jgi:hypothetical protein